MGRIFEPAGTQTKQDEKYPACKIITCPFCGCMSDNTCRIENVAESAPWLILDHADRIDYCNRPKIFANKLKIKEAAK